MSLTSLHCIGWVQHFVAKCIKKTISASHKEHIARYAGRGIYYIHGWKFPCFVSSFDIESIDMRIKGTAKQYSVILANTLAMTIFCRLLQTPIFSSRYCNQNSIRYYLTMQSILFLFNTAGGPLIPAL